MRLFYDGIIADVSPLNGFPSSWAEYVVRALRIIILSFLAISQFAGLYVIITVIKYLVSFASLGWGNCSLCYMMYTTSGG